MRPGGSLPALIGASALLAGACSEGTARPAAGPPAVAVEAAQPARPRAPMYPAPELERMARIAAARCKKANTPSDACLLEQAAAFLRYPPQDPDCRYVAGTALSVAECSEFEQGCLSVDPGDLVRQLDALQEAGKDCQRDPTDAERDAVLKLAGAR
ncbi:hypothetical protein WME99_43835 [Sorangium sp. So ce136]|uniref:hypothetical protein n=1 Tax=Sorangium sp. So ce136 TaxID=3133284 RepID=UPI003F063452